ncbi:Hypothetical protein ORPV_885 [Orpheovirus IHUMI-LCC2]|uniref:Uncharacterized protein n=1 Tax=Orpheovirus IHUMI-LCC2 TaxID=2023057 RepID=A0A2I2L5Q7_9VIRU|nr:Hypothetical protein ORPV_885 [Orpheovirus IHUMI-LCC2]SNW62789.1 Hypothetical protein ORPV_885 [Orpheovirus IHUMI-LCC2]
MQDIYNIKYEEDKSFMLTDHNVGVLYGTFKDNYHVWITNGLSKKLRYNNVAIKKGRRAKVKQINSQIGLDPRHYEFAIFVHKNDAQTYNLLKDNAQNLIGMLVNIHFIDNVNFMGQIDRLGALSMEVSNFGIEYCLLSKVSGPLSKILKDNDDRKVCTISHLHPSEVERFVNKAIEYKDFLKESVNKGVNYLVYNINKPLVC